GALALPGVLQIAILLVMFVPARLAARRRLRFQLPGRRWFWGGMVLAIGAMVSGFHVPRAILFFASGLAPRYLANAWLFLEIGLLFAGLVAMLVGAIRIRRGRSFPGKVLGLLAQGHFGEARNLVLQRKSSDPALRYLAAIAGIAAGDRALG